MKKMSEVYILPHTPLEEWLVKKHFHKKHVLLWIYRDGFALESDSSLIVVGDVFSQRPLKTFAFEFNENILVDIDAQRVLNKRRLEKPAGNLPYSPDRSLEPEAGWITKDMINRIIAKIGPIRNLAFFPRRISREVSAAALSITDNFLFLKNPISRANGGQVKTLMDLNIYIASDVGMRSDCALLLKERNLIASIHSVQCSRFSFPAHSILLEGRRVSVMDSVYEKALL